ncbi:MAG: hypothetical protein GWN86_29860 [Desulfobacterales bacterium]|nr:hypothetical protein [Desulfobacterales bacterium]
MKSDKQPMCWLLSGIFYLYKIQMVRRPLKEVKEESKTWRQFPFTRKRNKEIEYAKGNRKAKKVAMGLLWKKMSTKLRWSGST